MRVKWGHACPHEHRVCSRLCCILCFFPFGILHLSICLEHPNLNLIQLIVFVFSFLGSPIVLTQMAILGELQQLGRKYTLLCNHSAILFNTCSPVAPAEHNNKQQVDVWLMADCQQFCTLLQPNAGLSEFSFCNLKAVESSECYSTFSLLANK